MKLTTNYLGLTLSHPLMPGASPLVGNLDIVRRLEDAGAAAIVMHSLFEEQITLEERAYIRHVEQHKAFLEAAQDGASLEPNDFNLTPDLYLAQIQRIKAAVAVPVIASLNGKTLGGWIEYARKIEEAGANALELNYYDLADDPAESSADVEDRALEILHAVCANTGLPVAMKLSPFFSALPHFAKEAVDTGASGLVLFNRFYQPDIDIENLDVFSTLQLSDSSDLRLRLRWLAILSGTVETSYAITGGVHTAEDVIKAIMVGANAVQMTSALLKRGSGWLGDVLRDVADWLYEHEYDSLEQLCGLMNLRHSPRAADFERANYLRILQSWGA